MAHPSHGSLLSRQILVETFIQKGTHIATCAHPGRQPARLDRAGPGPDAGMAAGVTSGTARGASRTASAPAAAAAWCPPPATAQPRILEQLTPEFIAYMRSKIPMERFGVVDEVASLVCWLSSPECSFSTGAVFDISGGRATY